MAAEKKAFIGVSEHTQQDTQRKARGSTASEESCSPTLGLVI